MDISRQAFSEANTTGVSMYLSFDSSISSAAYKTLEATTCDLSMLSNMDHEEATVENSQEIHQNSTLEALDSHLNYLESVKDMDACSKLTALPKRILQEYNVVSSTPTKEQLLRSVEVVRGSCAERCVDLKFAFMDMDDKKVNNPTDKENALPPKEVTAISNKNDEAPLRTIIEETSVIDEMNTNKHKEEPNIEETTPKATNSKISITDKLPRDPEKPENKGIYIVSDINKRKSLIKKPLCEPDLKANRPSRISMNPNNRYTLNNIGTKSNIDKEIKEIPKLMNKVLKFAEATITENDKSKTTSLSDARKSISYNPKGRSSMLPSSVALQGEKRPFAFTQRMSVLVKTTLNSPARKLARRSVLPNTQQNRKSTIPTGLSHNNRKSMLPIGKTVQTEVNTKCTQLPNNESTKQGPTNRKSMYPVVSAKAATVPPLTAPNTKTRPTVTAKPESIFVCKVCGCKFSLKSLLDAHKRSHEGDGIPAFVKKTTTNAASTTSSITNSNNGNKCKYCDKKFVLLRALHIHLLQNCPKIPPNDKRKLKFHEMDHVEKAQLPSVFHVNTSGAKINSQIQNTLTNVPPQRSHSDLSSISVSSTDSTNDKKALAEITIIANTAAAAVDGLLPEMAPPAARVVKKTTAHAGIHRTPNKAIICHICKMSFKCIMDHIQHNMTVHFKNTETPKSNDEIDARKITTNANASAAKQTQ